MGSHSSSMQLDEDSEGVDRILSFIATMPRRSPPSQAVRPDVQRGACTCIIAIVLVFSAIILGAPEAEAFQPDWIIEAGESVVVTEDSSFNVWAVYVYGNLTLDGVDFYIHCSNAMFVFAANVFVSGTLRIVNGTNLHGRFMFQIEGNGSVHIVDSTVTGTPTGEPCAFWIDDGSLDINNSSVDIRGPIVEGRGANVSICNSTLVAKTRSLASTAVALFDNSVLALVGCDIAVDGSALLLQDTAASLIQGCTFEAVVGSVGMMANWSAGITILDTAFRGFAKGGMDLQHLPRLKVSGLTVVNTTDVALKVSNSTDVDIVDLAIGNVTGEGIGLQSLYNERFTARNVYVTGATIGIYTIYSNSTTLEDVMVDDCGRYGFELSMSNDVTIRNFSAREANVDGVYAGFCDNLKLFDGSVDGAGETGAFLTHSSTSITNVSASRCGKYGVRAATHSTYLVRCNLSHNGEDGLFSLDQGGVGVSNSTIVGNGEDGLRFLNSQRPRVSKSTVGENGDAGVRVYYMSKEAKVQDCDIWGNRFGLVLNGATNLSQGSTAVVRETFIHNNSVAGAFTLGEWTTMDARYCWWGNNTGPTNSSRNPPGTGDEVWGAVDFRPWIKWGNLPPIVSGPQELDVFEESAVIATYSAMDWDNLGERLTFGLEGAPPNLTIDTVTGELYGMMDDGDVGEWSFLVTVRDPEGGVGRLRVWLTVTPVNDEPLIQGPTSFSVGDDEEFVFQLRVEDVDSKVPSMNWTKVAGPDWLQVTTDGRLLGTSTPLLRGEHELVVRVDDGDGGSDEATVTVMVVPHYGPVSLQDPGLHEAYEDEAFGVTFQAEADFEAILTWNATVAQAWLSFEGQSLMGTPSQDEVGNHSVIVSVWDQFGTLDTLMFTFEVLPVNDPPRWDGAPTSTVVNSNPYHLDLAAYVSDPDDALKDLDLLCEHPNARFEGTTLVLEFAAGDPPCTLELVLSDPAGANATHPMEVTITIPLPKPDLSLVGGFLPWLVILIALVVGIAAAYVRRSRTRTDD